MNAARDFLRRAALAERAADAVEHLGYRDHMLSIARTWRERAAGLDPHDDAGAADCEPQTQVLM